MAGLIPVIDLGPYLAGRPGALQAAAAQLRSALEGVGFFTTAVHGCPGDLIRGRSAEARPFHASLTKPRWRCA